MCECQDGHPGHSNECQAPSLHGYPRTLVVRKTAGGTLFVSLSEGEFGASIAIASHEVQFEMMEVIRDEGPREFTLSY